jgi:hypothetical protein
MELLWIYRALQAPCCGRGSQIGESLSCFGGQIGPSVSYWFGSVVRCRRRATAGAAAEEVALANVSALRGRQLWGGVLQVPLAVRHLWSYVWLLNRNHESYSACQKGPNVSYLLQ